MRPRSLVATAAGLVAAVTTLLLARPSRRTADPSAPTPVADGPTDAPAPPPELAGRPSPQAPEVPPPEPPPPPGERAALVAFRKARERDHALAVTRHEQGFTSLAEVEAAALALLDARHRLGEVTEATWRAGRVEHFERAEERLARLVEAGFATETELERARLALARELQLAGREHAYEELREALLRGLRDRTDRLVEAGLLSRTAAGEQVRRLEEEFPPLTPPR
jgi:hypothetical protein